MRRAAGSLWCFLLDCHSARKPSLDSLGFGLLEGGGTENERSLAVAKAD